MNAIISAINENIINPLIILMFAVALIVFLWGVLQYVAKAGDSSAIETARMHILYGILGMFIMVSAFGIIRIVTGTFGIDEAPLDQIEK